MQQRLRAAFGWCELDEAVGGCCLTGANARASSIEIDESKAPTADNAERRPCDAVATRRRARTPDESTEPVIGFLERFTTHNSLPGVEAGLRV